MREAREPGQPAESYDVEVQTALGQSVRQTLFKERAPDMSIGPPSSRRPLMRSRSCSANG